MPAILLSERALTRRAAAGDAAAFAAIFERYRQPLYRYCYSIVANAEDAADALQNTMASALGALAGEDREISLKPWLYRIAHNESLSLVRGRRPQVELDVERDGGVQPSAESQVLGGERLREVFADIGALPERQRGALLMRELSGLSYSEIALAFEVSDGAARQLVYEGRTMALEFAMGREMDCADVQRLISARDGRLLRSRQVRAHLRACDGCERFRDSIRARRTELAAFAPVLSGPAAAGIAQRLLAKASLGGHSGGIGVAAGSGGLQATASALLVKAAVLAAAAAVSAGAVAAPRLLDRGTHRVTPATSPSSAAHRTGTAAPARAQGAHARGPSPSRDGVSSGAITHNAPGSGTAAGLGRPAVVPGRSDASAAARARAPGPTQAAQQRARHVPGSAPAPAHGVTRSHPAPASSRAEAGRSSSGSGAASSSSAAADHATLPAVPTGPVPTPNVHVPSLPPAAGHGGK